MKILRKLLNQKLLKTDINGFRLPWWMSNLNRQVVDRPWFKRVWQITVEGVTSTPYGAPIALPAPVLLTAELTGKCDRLCRNCCSSRSMLELRHASPERLVECVADLDVPNILLSGGEPLQHPDIDGIVEALQDRNLTIATDGDAAAIDDMAARLRLDSNERQGNVAFLLSIYGGEGLHDDLRWQGSFKNLRNAARVLNARRIRYSINCVLSDISAEALSALAANCDVFSPWKIYVSSLMEGGSCKCETVSSIPRSVIRRRIADLRHFIPGRPIIMAYPSATAPGWKTRAIDAIARVFFGLPISVRGCGANAWLAHLDVSGTFRPCPFVKVLPPSIALEPTMAGAAYWRANRRSTCNRPLCGATE